MTESCTNRTKSRLILVNIVQIFSKVIGMAFGISKCPTLIMKRDISKSEGIQLPNDEFIKILKRERDTNTWIYWKMTNLRT